MLKTLAAPEEEVETLRQESDPERRHALLLVSALTLTVFAVHGYHPYVEDGGLYLAGVKHLLDPTLYAHNLPFVAEHPRFSLFGQFVAEFVRLTHVGVDGAVLLLYGLSVWVTLFAVWQMARRCFVTRRARWWGVAAVAVGWTTPIAGTSVLLMDPYLTARSLATPMSLLAIVAGMDWMRGRRSDGTASAGWVCCGWLVGGFLMHPLLGAFAAGLLLAMGAMSASTRRGRAWLTAAFFGAVVLGAAVVQSVAPKESAASLLAISTRGYWFIGNWHWYELLGLVAPMAILGAVMLYGARQESALRKLAAAGLVVGVTCIAVALLCGDPTRGTMVIARLQPLRMFRYLYFVTLVAMGGTLGLWLDKVRAGWAVLGFAAAASLMVFFERQTYPATERFELPAAWRRGQVEGPWVEAFLWVRSNTPKDAMFAMDPHYFDRAGEDAHGFRALAERSVLPDITKDGGDAATKPDIAELWVDGTRMEEPMEHGLDRRAETALRRHGVTWVLIPSGQSVDFRCAYGNQAVKVCQLP